MNQSNQKSNRKALEATSKICKHCGKNERVTLYFCQVCREKHNARTRELKRRYRKESRCVDCGKPSNTRYCEKCKIKYKDWNSRINQNKRIKQGYYGKLERIMEVI